MTIPTIAEVREALAIAGMAFGMSRVAKATRTAAAMNALLDRLDPSTQVIVDRDTLAAALHRLAEREAVGVVMLPSEVTRDEHSVHVTQRSRACEPSDHLPHADAILAAIDKED